MKTVKMQHPEFDSATRAKRGANHALKRLAIAGQDFQAENEFDRRLFEKGLELQKAPIEILQINLGKLCNLTCHHCHVEAGPDRTEMVTADLINRLVEVGEKLGVSTVDLTGGAPEMIPGFRECVRAFRNLGTEVIVRSNLTILVEPGYEDCIDFFVDNQVRVTASLPCYTRENVDKQRGDGVFEDSIQALLKLNAAGYGARGSNLFLDLVYNPGGASLPGPQDSLEAAYKEHLLEDFGIRFNKLFCITNLPIGRFYSDLKKEGKAEAYDNLLRENFNEATVSALMCRNTLNVSWDGWVYDCDFNQMLELPMTNSSKQPLHICDEEILTKLSNNSIATGNHCFGCTAGAGSSCTGELL